MRVHCGMLRSPGGSRGGQGARVIILGGPEGPCWALAKRIAALGGSLGAPGVCGGPQGDFDLFEKQLVLDPSDTAKETKKRVKWLTVMQVKSRRYQKSRY